MDTAKTKEDAILIRDMRKSDLDDLLDLLPRCFAKEFEVTGFDPDHARAMFNRAFGGQGRLFLALAGVFGREPGKLLAAEAKDRVIGTTIVGISGRIGYVSTVMVHPDYRGKGIATALVKRAIEYVQTRKKDRALLHADSTNLPAIGVYSRLGFEPFEQIATLVADTDSLSVQEASPGVETRLYQVGDEDEVYRLVLGAEDANQLRVHDFSKRDLRMPFWVRLFGLSTQRKIVAVSGGRILGYVEVEYTTPKETGNLSSIEISPEEETGGIVKALVNAAISEFRKGGVRGLRVMVSTTKGALIETLVGLGFKQTLTMVGMTKETRESVARSR